MDIYSIQTLLSSAGIFLLAIILFVKDRHSRLYIVVSLFMLSVALWQFDLFLLRNSADTVHANLYSRLLRPSILFAPYLFLVFSRIFSKDGSKTGGYIQNIMLIISLLGAILSFAGVGFKDMVKKSSFGYAAQPDLIYMLVMFNTVTGFLTGVFYIVKKFIERETGSIEKKQIQYFALGSVFGFVAALTNVLNVYGLPVYPLGGFGAFVFLLVVAYSVLSHNLLNIREFLQKVIVYSVISAAVISFYYLIYISLYKKVGSYELRALIIFMSTLIITVTFNKVLGAVDVITKRAFFIAKKDFQELLGYLTGRIRYLRKLENIMKEVIEGAVRILSLKKSVIFFWNPKKLCYILYEKEANDSVCLAEDHPLVLFFKRISGPVFVKELYDEVVYRDRPLPGHENIDLPVIINFLRRYNAELCLPIKTENDVKGVWIIGEKINKNIFKKEEINWLENLASQVSAVAENIILYEKLIENDRFAMLGKMSAAIAHEIRNPLTGMSSFLQMAVRGGEEAGEAMYKFMEIAPGEFKRLERLTNNLLALNRAVEVKLRKNSVVEMIDDVNDFLSVEYRKNHIKLIKRIEESPVVLCDSEQITQVLLNVIINSIWEMQNGGVIDICVKTEKRGAKLYAAVIIKDTGPGIAEDLKDKVFEAFFSTKAEGTGLGLAISKKIIEAHKGILVYEGSPEGGAAFKILLPAFKENNK